MRAIRPSWWLAALVSLGAGLLGCGGDPAPAPVAPAARPGRPNIVLVTLDTTRADHLGCYGYSNAITPALDAFAGEAVVFENAWCSAAVTPVSHASILSGLHPYTHGLRGFGDIGKEALAGEVVTLPLVLRHEGYRTAAFVSAITVGSAYGLDRGFDLFDEDFSLPRKDIAIPDRKIYWANTQRHAGETTDRALRWLQEAPEPYLLWVHYFDPHDPVVLPPPAYRRVHPTAGDTPRAELRAIYDMEIGYLDEQFGRLMTGLESAGQGARTIVVVVSDHGEGLGDHDWWTHGILYQEQIRAALLVKAPGLAGGRRVAPLVRTIDLLPTILDLAGIDPRAAVPVEGRSLVPLLRGVVEDSSRIAYAEAPNLATYPFAAGITDVKQDRLFCVSDGRWKYIEHVLRPEDGELYDLSADPRELRNRYADQPEVVARLRAELHSRPFLPAAAEMNEGMAPALLHQLRSLGYLR